MLMLSFYGRSLLLLAPFLYMSTVNEDMSISKWDFVQLWRLLRIAIIVFPSQCCGLLHYRVRQLVRVERTACNSFHAKEYWEVFRKLRSNYVFYSRI